MPDIPFWLYLVIIVLGIAILLGIIKFITKIFLKFVLALIWILIFIGLVFFLLKISGII